MKSLKLQPGLTASPKRGRGRPRKPITVTELEDINPDSNEVKSARSLKSELTLKELKFLEIYLTGGVSIDKAMISAGYGNYSEDGRYYIAKKIKEKYETRTGDHRKIFRAIGAGELAVARGLLEIAQTASSADVRRKAWADIASCMGLKSEVVESFQGVSIIIRGENDGDLPPGSQGKPLALPALPAPPKVTQIIK